MSELATADLETGAETSPIPVSPTPAAPASMEDVLDAAIDNEPWDIPTEGDAPPATGVDRGDGRDVHGKFATKAEQDAADAKAQATQTAPGAQAPKPTEPKPGEQLPPAAGTPFRYRALGQTHELEGSTLDANGNITVPAAKAGDVREAFNALHLVRGEIAPTIERYKADIVGLTQKLTEATEGRSAKEAQAEKLVDALTAAFSEPDDEKKLGMLWQLAGAFPQLLANAERDHWKTEAERRAKAPAAAAPATASAEPAQPSMPTPDAARATTSEYVEQFKIAHQYRDLTADDWKQLEGRYAATPFAFLRLATAEDAKLYPGVQPGSVVFDTDALEADIRSHATAASAQRETAKGVTQLATANARRTQSTVSAPPTASGTHAPPAPARRFKNKEEWEAWKASDDIDED